MSSQIAQHKKARYEYHLAERIEAGLALEGWEVKSLRAGKVQINDSYVIIKHSEMWLIGSVIQPLNTASTHKTCDPQRTRKLLLHRTQINTLLGKVERKGFTIVPTNLYWKKNHIKLEIALAKGKHTHDKRATIKEREWERQKHRVLKQQRDSR